MPAMSADSPSSSCSRGSDGCEIKGRHDMCGTVQKPEMVEKAREIVTEWDRKFDADEPQGWADITAREWLIKRVALALEAVASKHMDVIGDLRRKLAIAGVEGSPPPFEATIPRLIRERREIVELLRASEASVAEWKALWLAENAELIKVGERNVELEASVESLRKESRRWESKWINAMDDLAGKQADLEAARAEATKAERERLHTLLEKVQALIDPETSPLADSLIKAELVDCNTCAAIRAPRPPSEEAR